MPHVVWGMETKSNLEFGAVRYLAASRDDAVALLRLCKSTVREHFKADLRQSYPGSPGVDTAARIAERMLESDVKLRPDCRIATQLIKTLVKNRIQARLEQGSLIVEW